MDPTDIARWQFAIITVYHFLFVPDHDRPLGDRRRLRDRMAAHRQRAVAPPDQVLRQALPHQLRHRRGHRHRPGVPVRHELERLLTVRRRHLRRPAGRSRGCSRSSSSRPSSVCGSSAGTGSRPRLHAACIWLVHIGTLFSAYFILAANSWMQHPVGYELQPRDRPRRDERLRRGAVQQGAAGDIPARRAVGLHDRSGVRRRGRRSGTCAGPQGRRTGRDVRCTAGRCAPAPPSCWLAGWASRSPATSRARS